MSTVQEIEQAISALSFNELSELRVWMDEQHANLFDERIAEDFHAGRLDDVIQRALEEDAAGRTRPL